MDLRQRLEKAPIFNPTLSLYPTGRSDQEDEEYVIIFMNATSPDQGFLEVKVSSPIPNLFSLLFHYGIEQEGGKAMIYFDF